MLILGYTQPILQRFYCKIYFGKNVSIQEKGIPEFPNTVELVMFFSLPKSSVERTSSLLTTLLNDRRISMAYDTCGRLPSHRRKQPTGQSKRSRKYLKSC